MTLLGGADAPTMGQLRVRKSRDGVKVEGEAPQRHTFPRQFLVREINDAVRITVTVPSDPPVVYEVDAIEAHDRGITALVGSRVDNPDEAPPAKRKWWQRKNNG
jgi:hypothetical protein